MAKGKSSSGGRDATSQFRSDWNTLSPSLPIIESQFFLTLLKMCIKCKRDNVRFSKADALRNGILKRAERMKTELKEEILKNDSAVHFCLDTWTSANQFSLLAITAQYRRAQNNNT
jgi:hypothetical protein